MRDLPQSAVGTDRDRAPETLQEGRRRSHDRRTRTTPPGRSRARARDQGRIPPCRREDVATGDLTGEAASTDLEDGRRGAVHAEAPRDRGGRRNPVRPSGATCARPLHLPGQVARYDRTDARHQHVVEEPIELLEAGVDANRGEPALVATHSPRRAAPWQRCEPRERRRELRDAHDARVVRATAGAKRSLDVRRRSVPSRSKIAAEGALTPRPAGPPAADRPRCRRGRAGRAARRGAP